MNAFSDGTKIAVFCKIWVFFQILSDLGFIFAIQMNKLGINVKTKWLWKLEKYFLLLALGVFAFALQSCDDDDNDGISVPRNYE